MPEKLSNEQRHERYWCAFTHIRVAWAFIAFCAWAVFLSWKGLDKPIPRPSLFELPFYILVVVVYAPIFWMVLRCFTERFVGGIVTVDMAIAVVSWFLPTLFNPVAGLVRRAFFVLWTLAFLMSLNMAVQSVRHPYVEPEKVDARMKNRGLLILGAVIATALLFAALLYFVPLRYPGPWHVLSSLPDKSDYRNVALRPHGADSHLPRAALTKRCVQLIGARPCCRSTVAWKRCADT